jgi:predicted aspartyl protease
MSASGVMAGNRRTRRTGAFPDVLGTAALGLFALLSDGALAQGQASPQPAAPQAGASAETEPAPEFATPTKRDRVGRIVTPVKINGRGPFRFVLDTGANRSVISAAAAAKLGLVPHPDAQASVHGITGSAAMPVVEVESLTIGNLKFERQRMPVMSSPVFAGMDGILGIDRLQEARIEVDFDRDRVTIRRSTGRRAPEGYLVVPATLRQGGLLLVDGRVGAVPVKAILDTGAERSIGNEALREALAEHRRRPPETVTSTVIGATPQVVQGVSFEAPDVEIGGARLMNLVVTFGDLHVFDVWSLHDEPALLIGMDLLGTVSRFVVDYPRREFHVKASSSPPRGIRHCGAFDCRSRIPQGQ